MTDHATIFGDIHSNIHALDAILTDMDARNLSNRYCLGDLVGYGAFPNQVIKRVREQNVPVIMGNYDQGVGISSPDCGCAYSTEEDRKRGDRSIAWTNIHTTDENKTYLRGLLAHTTFRLGDHNVMLVHGSPRKINEYMFEDRGEAYFERIMNTIDADVLVCGHTHLPYHKVLPSGRQVVNAGSVGKPKDNNPKACYIVLRADGRELDVAFIRVDYPIEEAATAIEAADGMPDTFAMHLREGRS